MFFCSIVAYADVIVESFSNTDQKDSATAVWNQSLGIVHPGLQISNYQVMGFPIVPLSNFSVGDGSDGPFNVSTYANFGTVSGTEIIINALTRPSINVTSFQLDAGYTLTAINGPLVIYSLSTVSVSGTINCDGQTGQQSTSNLGGAGGLGRCGGRVGGSGGDLSASGNPGLPIGPGVSGGQGGTYAGVSAGSGGGGGAAYSDNDGASGQNSTSNINLGGIGGIGSGNANHEFTILDGSPGGGGGSGSSTAGGGGGGGGGGTVIIHAVGNISINAGGLISARGGSGGGSLATGPESGGGGGGGGGGSVKIFTAGNLELNSGTSVDVAGGTGGIPASLTAGIGGVGSFGRTWLNYTTFSGAGTESHPSLLQSLGAIEYNTVAQQVISKAYDVSSTTVIYNSISTDITSADLSLEVAGSTDNFASSDTGWLPSAQISNLNNHRYIKFKINLTNSAPTSPTVVSAVNINYNPNLPTPPPAPTPNPSTSNLTQETFKFSGGCGAIKTESSEWLQILLMTLMMMPLIAAFRLRNIKLLK